MLRDERQLKTKYWRSWTAWKSPIPKIAQEPYSAWWKPMAEALPVADRAAIATPVQP